MKVVLLAGGLGTRLSEETALKPKPMVEVGTRPILLHIMDIYASHGFNDFVICLGYKGYYVKEYFHNLSLHHSDVTFDFSDGGKMRIHRSELPNWKVTLVDTGELTQTGGRLARVREYLGNERFMLTYGDGLSDVDIRGLVKYHIEQKRLATVTAVQPPGRFGAMAFSTDDKYVTSFEEKPQGDGGWINGGFFVMEPGVFDYLGDDTTVLEQSPLQSLARNGQLSVFKHDGFWRPMDSLRDKRYLDSFVADGKTPPWRKKG